METLNLRTDEELVALFMSGNNEAFDELLQRYQEKLYNYILYIVRNNDVADDIFQETFVKVIVSLRQGRYKETGRFYAWLTRIAHNMLIDQFRFEKNEPHLRRRRRTRLARNLHPARHTQRERNRQRASAQRRAPNHGPFAGQSERGGLYEILSRPEFQRDIRHHGRQHQHRARQNALRHSQHAPTGKRTSDFT